MPVKQRIVRVYPLARRRGVGYQHSDRPRPVLAGHAHAPFRVGNAAREDEIDGRLEIIRVLLEKGPRLGKENLEALVDSNLRLVGFDLAEVGIGGRVDDELVFEHQLGVQAHLPERGSSRVKDMVGVVQVKFLKRARNAIGYELNVPARRNLFQTGSRALLIEPSLDAAGIGRPEGVFTGAGNFAVQDDPPGLRVARGEAKAAKRNREPYDETSIGHFTDRVPDRIE